MQPRKIGRSREVVTDARRKENFERLWLKYFGDEELPLTFFYAGDEPAKADVPEAPKGQRCVMGDLARAKRGRVLHSPRMLPAAGGQDARLADDTG